MTSMVEGEKLFDIAIRWPQRLRNNETSILDIPVDIINNQVVLPQGSSPVPTPERQRLGHSRPVDSRHAGQHGQSHQQYAAAAAARPGLPGGRGRLAGPRRPVRAGRRADDLSASRASA